MGLDAFGRMVRDIRLVRAMLLYDMAKDLDISPAELSAIECGRKPVPDWFISKLQEKIRHQRYACPIAYQIHERTG